jgi:hypothetical protein
MQDPSTKTVPAAKPHEYIRDDRAASPVADAAAIAFGL